MAGYHIRSQPYCNRAQLYTSSWQAPYHSFRRKRQNSFILLPLLSPQSFATLRGPREVIAFSEGSSPEGCDFPQSWSAPNHTGDATLPLRWLPPATLLWTCHLGTSCIASCSQPTSFIKYAIFSIGNEV